MPPDTKRNRPGGNSGGFPEAQDGGFATKRNCCKWLMAAARTGDHDVVATVVSLHPPWRCPAWRESAA